MNIAKHVFMLVLIVGCFTAAADKPLEYSFAVEIYKNGKLVGNAVPDKKETYQDVASEFLSETMHMFTPEDVITLRVHYPTYDYEPFMLNGCMVENAEGGIIGWVTKKPCN